MQKHVYQAKQPDNNGRIPYDATENETWKILYERQLPIAERYACQAYLDGLTKLQLPTDHVPQCNEVSSALRACTGWAVEPVPALIPFEKFYELLASQRFPAASFIRIREELDYLQEPDIFHEIFGHCPLLTDPAFAHFSQAFGELGLRTPKQYRARLQRLYWFTVEFGLLATEQGARAYGGGILSSKSETIYSVDSAIPLRKPFDAMTILRTPYRYDQIQTTYFVIQDFTDFYRLMDHDLLAMTKEAEALGDFDSTVTEEIVMETPSC